jgi:hypothetical protein
VFFLLALAMLAPVLFLLQKIGQPNSPLGAKTASDL